MRLLKRTPELCMWVCNQHFLSSDRMMSLIVELERCKEVKDSDTRQSRLHACLWSSWRGCEDEAKDGGVEGYLQMMIFSMQHLT